MTRQSAVERAAAQAQRLRGLADVALEARERLLDEEPLDLLERHLLEPRRPRGAARGAAQREVGRAHLVAVREEHRALDRVVELADVARPEVVEQRLHRARVEAGELLA